MAKWKVEAYELRTDGTKHGGDITESLLSGKLQLQLNDTNKFSFSIPRLSFPAPDIETQIVWSTDTYTSTYLKGWRKGKINDSTGNVGSAGTNAKCWICSPKAVQPNGKTLKIVPPTGYGAKIFEYTTANTTGFVNSYGSYTVNETVTCTITSGHYYRFTVGEFDDTDNYINDDDFLNSIYGAVLTPSSGMEIPDFAPLKTAVLVYRVGSTIQKMFTGIVTSRTHEVSDGVYKYQCEGALGMYKYMPPYRSFASGSDLDFVLQTLCDRFLGTATGAYEIFNPTTELYSKFPEFFAHFGDMSIGYAGLELNDNLANIQQSSSDAEAFIKAIIDPSCYTLPASFETPVIYETDRGQINITNIYGVNTQEIRYDRNLFSCTIEDIPYYTYAEVTYQGSRIGKPGPDYPGIFYYTDYEMEQTDTPYTATELERYADTLLAQPKQMITASGFDEGILDNGTPFLDMTKFAEVVYLEDGGERRIQAQITSITYNLTNPSQDRVQLGKKIVPLTQR